MSRGISIYAIILAFLFTLISCNSEDIKTAPIEDATNSTKEMVAELKAIANKRDNILIWHLNKERAAALDEQIKTTEMVLLPM
ncbi:MAG: uncharacterized membrane protein (DUF106 family) [Saprospiraceae bacterium]|jgi:uncharacterized membrane protein (DUF106 family)